jgi:ferredoxin-NADP reductase
METTRHFAPGRVRAARDVASDVRMIEIEPERGARPYATGAHLDIAVVIDELPDIRSYSLVGERPVDGAYRIAVKDVPDSRGGSRFVRALEPGAAIEVSEPESHFELQYGRPEYLLVAGGIGITPLVGMAHALERHGRPFRLLYAARRREQLAFVDELADRDDREVVVRRNRTMLDALNDSGVDMMWDCLRGECGLCAVHVLEVEGELDHRDVFLDEEQQAAGDTMLTCVSRAVGGAVSVDTGFRAGPRAQGAVQRVETR